MTDIAIGARFYYRGRTYVARERELRPDKGLVRNDKTGRYEPEIYICLSPEERAEKIPHWTDWVPEAHVKGHYTEIGPETEAVTKPRHGAAGIATQAAEEARASAPKVSTLTPKKRLQNRITSTRHKLKHPGRSQWEALEVKAMEDLIAATQAEIETL